MADILARGDLADFGDSARIESDEDARSALADLSTDHVSFGAPAAPAAPAPNPIAAPSTASVVETITQTAAQDAAGDGDGVIDVGESVTFTVTITNTGADAIANLSFDQILDLMTLDAGSENVSPLAGDDAYVAIGNVPMSVDAGSGLFGNDSEYLGDSFTLDSFDATSAQGGTVTVNADGSFSYESALGFSGTDTFTYTLIDSEGLTGTGTVTLDVGGPVWFIDNEAPAGGDGSQDSPFNSIAAFNAVNDGIGGHPAAGDTVYLREGTGTYAEADGVNLLGNQILIGGGQNLVVNHPNAGNITIETATTAPTISATAGDGVNIASGNSLRGFDIGNTSGAGIADSNGSVGNLTVSDVAIGGTGRIVEIDQGGALTVTLDSATTTSSAGDAIDLDGVSGAFTVTGATTISGLSAFNAKGIHVNGSSAEVIFEGVTDIDVGFSQSGVRFTGNTGTLDFTGGALDIDATDGASAFTATGGGAVTITGANNSINAGTNANPAGVYIDSTTIGAAGITLHDVSVGAGSSSGIYLNNAGTGGFTVTGDSGSVAGSGGTIGQMNGADGSGLYGFGVYVGNTSNVSLANMNFSGAQNYGIFGNNVTNFTLTDSVFTGGYGSIVGEDAVQFTNLLGTNVFQGNTIGGGFHRNIDIQNSSGTSSVTIRNTAGGDQAIVGLNATATGDDSVYIETSGTANLTATITGVVFNGARGDVLQINAIGNSDQTITVTNNSFVNAHTNIVSGGGGVTLSGGSPAGNIDVDYVVSGNSIVFANGNALTANYLSGDGLVQGSITGNTIGSAPLSSGSIAGAGISVGTNAGIRHESLIQSNGIQQIALGSGIELLSSNNSSAASGGMFADVFSNTIQSLGANALAGIYTLVGGAGSADTSHMSADIFGNTIFLTGAPFGLGIYLDQVNFPSNAISTYNLPGYGGPAVPTGFPNQVEIFLANQNAIVGGGQPNEAENNSAVIRNVTGTGTAGGAPVGAGFRPELAESLAGGDIMDLWIRPDSKGAAFAPTRGFGPRGPARASEDAAAPIAEAAAPPAGPSVETTAAPSAPAAPAIVARAPTLAEINAALRDAIAIDGSGPIVLGALPIGKSLTLTWTATVDPQTGQLIVNPVNTGTVTGDNIPTTDSNIVTTVLDSLTLEGQVFNDLDGDGVLDVGTELLGLGIALSLYNDDNADGSWDAGDTLLDTAQSSLVGYYQFAGLAEGNYLVVLDAANFQPAGALENLAQVTRGAVSDPDDNVDDDNNGVNLGAVIAAQAITLAFNTEPTAGTGNDTNTTLDFGVIDQDELLIGDANPNVLSGLIGNDTLQGLDENDTLNGDEGDDSIDGGGGNDLLTGGEGADALDGGADVNTASYEGSAAAVDVDLQAGAGIGGDAQGDTLINISRVIGSSLADTLTAANAGSELFGMDDADTLAGLGGDDLLHGGADADSLDGGGGINTASYEGSAAVTVDLVAGTGTGGDAQGDTLANIRRVIGSSFGDSLNGAHGGSELLGMGGADTLTGSFSSDTLRGGADDDSISGGAGDDLLHGGAGADALDGGEDGATASYEGSTAVTVDLEAGTGTGGDAQGDTLANIRVVIGSSFADSLSAASGGNILFGREGADTLTGLGGGDFLSGGADDDSIFGGNGFDNLVGGAGADTLDGGTGGNRAIYDESATAVTVDLDAGTGTGGDAQGDTLANILHATGSAFDDSLSAAAAGSELDGQSGNDTLTGGDGGDTLLGRVDNDSLVGGGGDDLLIGGTGADAFDGGTGTNTASYEGSGSGAITVDLDAGTGTGGDAQGDTFVNIRRVIGSLSADSLSAAAAGSELDGQFGNDTLTGHDGDDTLTGREGADALDGGMGFNTASYHVGFAGPITVDLAAGTGTGGDAQGDTLANIQRVIGSSFADSLSAATAGSELLGMEDADTLVGLGGGDTLRGGADTDSIFGDGGDDLLIGGADADALDGGTGLNTASYEGSAAVTIDLDAGTASGGDAQGDTFANIQRLIGSSFADSLSAAATGSALDGADGDDTLDGGDGGDRLDGGFGADALEAGEGDDTLVGGRGPDTLDGGEGFDTVDYSAASGSMAINLGTNKASGSDGRDDLTGIEGAIGGGQNDLIVGGEDNNRLSGRGGDDVIDGRGGDDIITGGAGFDRFVFGENWGYDRIVGFDANDAEKIDLSGVGAIDDFDDLFANHLRANGNNGFAEIFDGENVIQLHGITMAEIGTGLNFDANDFIFQI